MTVMWSTDGRIALQAECPSSDAEPLLALLLDNPEAEVDWRECEAAHAAVVQILFAARHPMVGPPRGAFLRRWVEPLLTTR